MKRPACPAPWGRSLHFWKNSPIPPKCWWSKTAARTAPWQWPGNLPDHFPGLRILHEDLPGKGRAVRRGVLEARGDYRLIADADFSMPVDQINRFLPPACTSDIAIASREAPGAKRYNEPGFRHLTGRVYNFWIRSLVLPGLQDTQCGFKCFRAGVAKDIFPRQTLTGWSFDVELLAIARRHGYSICRDWHPLVL